MRERHYQRCSRNSHATCRADEAGPQSDGTVKVERHQTRGPDGRTRQVERGRRMTIQRQAKERDHSPGSCSSGVAAVAVAGVVSLESV